MRLPKGKRLILFALLGLVLVPVSLVLAHPRGRTALRLAPGFTPLPEDPRVYYEPVRVRPLESAVGPNVGAAR